MAALLGLFLFTLTCGVALAAPVFYAKIENKTNSPVKIWWHFCTRAGANPNPDSISVIQPGHTMRYNGKPGQGRMVYKWFTGGEGGKWMTQHVDGVTDPMAVGAYIYIKLNQEGFLRIYKPNG